MIWKNTERKFKEIDILAIYYKHDHKYKLPYSITEPEIT